MENNFINSIVKVCNVFHKHSVQYLIVGGAAVALHGYFRRSMNIFGKPADKPDLDFWYYPSYNNYFNLLYALEELGFDVTEFKEERIPNPKKSFFKFETEAFTLDLLPKLISLNKFKSSFKEKEIVDLNGTQIWFINFEDLIKDKVATSRPKDLIDIEQLKIRNNSEK